MKKVSKWKFFPIFFILIILQIAIFIYFGLKKEGLFIDEFWSFNLSNSAFLPLLKNATPYVGKILDGEFLRNVTTVQPDQQFWFFYVVANQARDVHPPLYYCMIHAICSFFPNTFSKWYGIIPNIVLFSLTQLVVYFLACKIWKGWFRLLPCAMLGLSIGAINLVTLIRMYALLTLICTCAFALHLWIALHIDEDWKSWPRWMIPGLFFTTLLGLFTHYYFILYLFFMGLFLLQLFKARKLMDTAKVYVKVMMVAISTALVFYPYIIGHIIFRGRGRQAFVDAFTSSPIDRIGMFLNILNQDFHFYPILALLACVLLFSFLSSHKTGGRRLLEVSQSVQMDEYIHRSIFRGVWQRVSVRLDSFSLSLFSGRHVERKIVCAYALAIALPIFIVLAKIVPLYKVGGEGRYIMFIFPLLAILFSILLYVSYVKVKMRFFRKMSLEFIFIAFIVVILGGEIFLKQENVKFMYVGEQAFVDDLHGKYKSDISVAVSAKDEGYDWYPAVKSFKYMREDDRFVVVPYESIDTLNLDAQSVTVYINNTEEEQDIAKRVAKALAMNHIEKIPYEKDYQGIYRMYR